MPLLVRSRVSLMLDEGGHVLTASVAKWVDGEKLTETTLSFEPFDSWEDVMQQVQKTLDFQLTLW